jgi:hypothetical protein
MCSKKVTSIKTHQLFIRQITVVENKKPERIFLSVEGEKQHGKDLQLLGRYLNFSPEINLTTLFEITLLFMENNH